jgi:hypothetical protein
MTDMLPRIRKAGYNTIQIMAIQVRRGAARRGAGPACGQPSRVLGALGCCSLPRTLSHRSPRPLTFAPHLRPSPPPHPTPQEHAYYGSFGYHVTNFFAASSRCARRGAGCSGVALQRLGCAAGPQPPGSAARGGSARRRWQPTAPAPLPCRPAAAGAAARTSSRP